jgi:hypothetical protein
MTDVVSPIIEPESVKAEPKLPDKQNDVIVNEATDAEITPEVANLIPLDKYSEDNGKPYAADYLGIFFWQALTPELDVNGVTQDVKQIDEYVKNEIAEHRLTNTVGSFKEVMDSVKESMGISDNETIESKLDKIRMYINLRSKIKEKKQLDEHLSNVAVDLKTIFKEG